MLVDGNYGGLTAADVAAVVNNRGGYGSNGFGGFNGDGAWWLIVLFLFALSGNGWGNGFGGGNGGMMPWMLANGTNGDVQRGFDQQAVVSGISGVQNAVTSGFAAAEAARCGNTMQILQALNANQASVTAGMNNLAMGLQNCCCENRAAVADLKYTVATENCADRQALNEGVRDIIANQNAGIQSIKDQLCQDKIDAKNDLIAQLRSELLYARGQASQDVQTAAILAGQTREVDALYQRLNDCPVGTTPVYGKQPIFTCDQNLATSGCGCSRFVA